MLAIAGGKGGSGKTTTTLGIARAIDGPAIAADADSDLPNLHALAGVPRDPAPDGPGHPDPAGARPGSAATARPARGRAGETRIVPAPRGAPEGVGGLLRRLRDRDGDAPVLVDCPAGAGPDATVPLRIADGALLVATPCVAALRDAAKTGAMARAVGTPVVGCVLTRARLSPPTVEDLLGCPVLATVPPASAPAAADPLGDPGVRRAYDELAATLVEGPKA
ncbi:MAG: CDP-4-keto-6-deoxy-D-glucose-3-dehydrase [Haloquadratum sp.]